MCKVGALLGRAFCVFLLLTFYILAIVFLGFKLNCQLHQIIVARFADEDLIIDFDNFVRCLIRLETLFSEYMLYHQTDTIALCFQVQDKLFRKLCAGSKATSRLSYKSSNPVCMILLLLDLGISQAGLLNWSQAVLHANN